MIVLGITGQTGAGKSIVSQTFKNRGVLIIDADKIAREVTLPGSLVSEKIKDAFGSEYFEDGTLNRKKLGKYVFENKDKLALLNSITHPAICSIIVDVIEKERKRKCYKAVAIDAPLLKQAGLDKFCDKVIVVVSKKENRLQRITSRDLITAEEADLRILRQDEEEYYTKNADKIFNNDGLVEKLISDVNKYADELGL